MEPPKHTQTVSAHAHLKSLAYRLLPALTELVRYREEQNTSVQASDPKGKEALSCTKVPGDTGERNQQHLAASRCVFNLEFGIYNLEEHCQEMLVLS